MKFWRLIEIIIRFIMMRILQLKLSEESFERIFQFVKFGMVGVTNTLISYITYVILVTINMHYLIASLLGFLVSVVNAFYWNNRYVFKSAEEEERTLWRSFIKTFVSYAGTGLILNNILLFFWIDVCRINEIVGPVINLFITIPLNFMLNKYWAFKTSKRNKR